MTRDAGQSSLQTPRTTLRRRPNRGSYDFETVASILDGGIFCHVGYVDEAGQPFVIPTNFGREGRSVYIHGSAASGMVRRLSQGVPLCLTVTIFDGLVLARSAHAHSVNYRSVVILGSASVVEGPAKLHAMEVISNHVVPGRWQEVRPPTEPELRAITVLRIEVEEASAKVRSGPPSDDEGDVEYPIWAGVLPFVLEPRTPVAAPDLMDGIELPEYLTSYRRPDRRDDDSALKTPASAR